MLAHRVCATLQVPQGAQARATARRQRMLHVYRERDAGQQAPSPGHASRGQRRTAARAAEHERVQFQYRIRGRRIFSRRRRHAQGQPQRLPDPRAGRAHTAMAYSQLFTVSVPVLAVHLNLLILDAHCGIPLDIREGGQLEQSIAERFPDATIRFEEPELNCHMLVSFASLACVAQARGSLAAFKVDVSITRLGKFIFRVSGASGSNAPFSREAEHDVIDGCRSLLAVLAPPPSRHRALEALDIDL